MNRKIDDFTFYAPRIALSALGLAAMLFGTWFIQFDYIYLNVIVILVCGTLAGLGIECAQQVIKTYRSTL